MTNQRLDRLAAAVLSARQWRDWTQLDVHAHGGPSNSTLTAIEDARPPGPSASTLRKLEKAFGWPKGAGRDLLNPAIDDAELDRRADASVFEQMQEDVASATTHLSDEQLVGELYRRLARARRAGGDGNAEEYRGSAPIAEQPNGRRQGKEQRREAERAAAVQAGRSLAAQGDKGLANETDIA